MFGGVQLLAMLHFRGEAASLDSFLRAYKTPNTDNYFPKEMFDGPEKLNNTQLPPYDTLFSKLPNKNSLEKTTKIFEI